MSQALKTGILWFVPSGDQEIRREQEGHEEHACLQEHQPATCQEFQGGGSALSKGGVERKEEETLPFVLSGAAGEGGREGGDGSEREAAAGHGTHTSGVWGHMEPTFLGFEATSGVFGWTFPCRIWWWQFGFGAGDRAGGGHGSTLPSHHLANPSDTSPRELFSPSRSGLVIKEGWVSKPRHPQHGLHFYPRAVNSVSSITIPFPTSVLPFLSTGSRTIW